MVSLDAARPRNVHLVDWWSATHVVWGVVLSVLIGPFIAVVLLTLWEPFEVLVLSRLAARRGWDFGHEALTNSLMDIVFDVLGVLLATFLLMPFFDDLPVWSPTIPGL